MYLTQFRLVWTAQIALHLIPQDTRLLCKRFTHDAIYWVKTIHSHAHVVYSQILIHTAEWTVLAFCQTPASHGPIISVSNVCFTSQLRINYLQMVFLSSARCMHIPSETRTVDKQRWSLVAGILRVLEYSRTCLGRPPLLPSKNGLSRQVVSRSRSYKKHVLPLCRPTFLQTARQ